MDVEFNQEYEDYCHEEYHRQVNEKDQAKENFELLEVLAEKLDMQKPEHWNMPRISPNLKLKRPLITVTINEMLMESDIKFIEKSGGKLLQVFAVSGKWLLISIDRMT